MVQDAPILSTSGRIVGPQHSIFRIQNVDAGILKYHAGKARSDFVVLFTLLAHIRSHWMPSFESWIALLPALNVINLNNSGRHFDVF